MTSAKDAIDEIRQARGDMSAECGHDPATFLAYLKSVEPKYARQVRRFQRLSERLEEERANVLV